MSFWHKIKIYLTVLRRTPNKYFFAVGVLLVMTLYIIMFREQTLAYNYSGDTCGRRLVLLPGIFSQAGGNSYEVTAKGGWNVAGHQITATSLCVSPVAAPTEHSFDTVAFAPWGGWLARFTYTIETREHPVVSVKALEEPIPASRELFLPLSEPDATFSYILEANEKKAVCAPAEEKIACNVPQLELQQGGTYKAKLEKYFKNEAVEEIIHADLETLSPLSVSNTSIQGGVTVYDKPESIVITGDKTIGDAHFSVWQVDGDTPTEIKASTEVNGQEVTVSFNEELPRQATIELRADSFEAADGSTPLDPYTLVFKTSGGPKVTGVNTGAFGVTMGAQIVVTFDQELSAEQDIAPLITVNGGVAFQGRQGNQLLFSTDGAGLCGNIGITLKADIMSPYDIAGQSAWQYNSRMQCYTVSTIGYSSLGRPIMAYHFGTGGPLTVYTGAIHGNEISTKYLMDRWRGELDANPGKIPAGKRVTVIPLINPDGFASGQRVNARNVDLNRNFAVSDWQKDIQHTDGASFPGGGGEQPMSEPETKVLAAFIAEQRPQLVLSYHSIGWMVISNQMGHAGSKASQYASLSGYRLSGGGGGEFGYQITGTADDYYREKLGVASVLIELGSHSYHQFERNQSAMWAMLQ